MTIEPLAQFAEMAWLAVGLLLGVGAVTLRQRVIAWRRARDFEWDPY